MTIGRRFPCGRACVARGGVCFLAAALLFYAAGAHAASVVLQPVTKSGASLPQTPVQCGGKSVNVWTVDEKATALVFKPAAAATLSAARSLYVQIVFVDAGYGRLSVTLSCGSAAALRPDRFLCLSRNDTKQLVTARMRIPGIPDGKAGDVSVRVGLERFKGETLSVASVTLADAPPADDPQFAYALTDPWLSPYTGPSIKPADNTTLKGKIMVGYQGWFRTPNDLEGHGWRHWGDVQRGCFAVDMWPDVSQYAPEWLEKAADAKTHSGKPAMLFSSTTPGVVDLHFRWMRENNIDGAFLQRFVSENFASIKGGPEWVLANTRAAANRHGRIWAVEYDVSGCPDAKLLEVLKKDWAWFVDVFGVLKDPAYAHEDGKPIVFVWGMAVSNRNITPQTANAVVDFFKNDPKYGGNYVIGGIPGSWRKMDAAWQEHFKKYHCIQPWMSQSYAEDIAAAKAIGVTYLAHAKPGFSWAHLKHLPGGDTVAYTPRDGGRTYWNALTSALQAGVDRICVGMFDEYDEGTAIMPMSDDAPPTPVRPGVGASFCNGAGPKEHAEFVLLPSAEFTFDGKPPCRNVDGQNFFVRLGGCIQFPAAGNYTLSVEGAPGDGVGLWVNNVRLLESRQIAGAVTAKLPVAADGKTALPFRLDYRHRTAGGTLRLFWEGPGLARQPVPASALQDAWGRFITNEGHPSDYYLKLTAAAKEILSGKRPANSPLP